MSRPTTPTDFRAHEPKTHYQTPNKAALKSASEFCERNGIKHSKTALFREYGFSNSAGYRALKSTTTRSFTHPPYKKETRGVKNKITEEQIAIISEIIEERGGEGRELTWEQLAMAAGVDACRKTIKAALGNLQYGKYIACERKHISNSTAENRCNYARNMLEKYPEPKDWYRVRWSNEMHFGWEGPRGRHYIIRKPGERIRPDCI
ncbi:MAG: hypothetical protein M1829_005821 [Trizodia sp. TS-e1964]|nr:MAG: hypothetical protein M1829_005821 [Trizodia sp. TS-e1964]